MPKSIIKDPEQKIAALLSFYADVAVGEIDTSDTETMKDVLRSIFTPEEMEYLGCDEIFGKIDDYYDQGRERE